MHVRYIGKLLVGALTCAAGLGLSGCRNLNPDFLANGSLETEPDGTGVDSQDTGASAELSTEEDSTFSASTSQTSQTSQTSEGLQSSDSSTQILDSASSMSTQTSEASSESSGTSDQELEVCPDGVQLCYPIYESSNSIWESEDLGPSSNPLLLSRPAGWTPGNVDTDYLPLRTSLWCKTPGLATSERVVEFKGEELGVDLWFAFDSWAEHADSTLVELDNVLAIRVKNQNQVECIASLSTGRETVTIDVASPALGLHHVWCSLDGAQLKVGFDAKETKEFNFEPGAELRAASAGLSVCAGLSLSPSRADRTRIAVLRLWDDIAKMNAVTKVEREKMCDLLNNCG